MNAESTNDISVSSAQAVEPELQTLAKPDPVNILLVDDKPENLAVLESILERDDYRLTKAQSAQEALVALINTDFALIVLDVRMPETSGFELAKIIKERKRTRDIPIVFVTAHYSEDQHILSGYNAGAVDYLTKPINPPILKSKVAVFAELYRKTKAQRSESGAPQPQPGTHNSEQRVGSLFIHRFPRSARAVATCQRFRGSVAPGGRAEPR